MTTSITPTISIKRGDTWLQRFEWIQSSNNLPVDLTGSIAKMEMVSSRGDQEVLSVSSEDSPPALTIDESNGIISLRVESEVTQTFAIGQYKTDLQVTFSDKTVKSTDIFYIRVIEDVTK